MRQSLVQISKSWPARSLIAFLIVVALLPLVVCGKNSEPSAGRIEDLFGVRTLLARAEYDGVLLVAGLAPDRYFNPDNDDLILGGAVKVDDEWRVRLLEPMPSEYGEGRGCSAERADELVPTGPAIVAACVTGGTNAVSYVAVLGIGDQASDPVVLLVVSCEATWYEVDGDELRLISTGAKPGAATPGEPHPDITMRWSSGLFFAEDEDKDAYATFCVERGGEFGYP